jgi:hypothetical protein
MKVTKKKAEEKTILITGPNCRLDDRLYRPGETATIPAELADEWILTERAVETAEVKDDGR